MDTLRSLSARFRLPTPLYRRAAAPSPTLATPKIPSTSAVALADGARVAEAIAYLNARHPVLRVGLEDAMGFGHQSASIHVACRLRALGYTGRFEIVASEHTVPKLAVLLQSLGTDASAFYVIDFAEASRHAAPVGVVGGWGGDLAPLNARTCLALQPLQWSGTRAVCDGAGVHPLRVGPYAAYRYDAVPGVPLDRLIATLVDEASRPALAQIVRSVASGQRDLMMIYGMHHALHPKDVIRKITDALAAYHTKKVVCLVVDAFGAYPDACAMTDCFEVARTLGGASRVMTVACKKLPEPVFRALYNAATLPSILEGANTTNLVRLSGRPYLSVRTRDTGYPKIRGHRAARDNCEQLAGMLAGRRVFEVSLLRDFMVEAKRPGSDMCRYFAALGAQVRAPEADQVVAGVIALHKSLLRQG